MKKGKPHRDEESRPARHRRARRGALTSDRIITAAIELADRDGLAGVSMRAVARAVGVEAMSLYNHVAGKDALLDGMIERVTSRVYLPSETGDWREELRRQTLSFFDAMCAHRWLPLLLMSHFHIGEAMLAHNEGALGCLVGAGFDIVTAEHVLNAINSYLYGFALQESFFPIARGDYAAVAAEHRHRIPADRYPRIAELSSRVIDGTFDGVNDITFGLDLLLGRLAELRPER